MWECTELRFVSIDILGAQTELETLIEKLEADALRIARLGL